MGQGGPHRKPPVPIPPTLSCPLLLPLSLCAPVAPLGRTALQLFSYSAVRRLCGGEGKHDHIIMANKIASAVHVRTRAPVHAYPDSLALSSTLTRCGV